jgi:AraC-like DNA-binding protein/mannose-6-phosphate isomerase-like protein (cupin superfamily)
MNRKKARVLGYERFSRRFLGERVTFPAIKSILIAYSEKPSDYSWPAHFHPTGTEIYYVDRGRLVMASLGRKFILKEGEAAVFPPRVPHAVEGDPKNPPNILMLKVNSGDLLRFVPEISSLAGRPIRVEETAKYILANLCRRIKSGDRHAGRFAAISTLWVLLGFVGEAVRNKPPDGGEGNQGISGGFAANVEEYVKTHLGEKLSIPRISRAIGCSASALCHRYRRLTGGTPHRLVMRFRMERARDLLRKPDMPVKMVAREVGFASVPSFMRAFRRIEHVTPGEYRRGVLSRI